MSINTITLISLPDVDLHTQMYKYFQECIYLPAICSYTMWPGCRAGQLSHIRATGKIIPVDQFGPQNRRILMSFFYICVCFLYRHIKSYAMVGLLT